MSDLSDPLASGKVKAHGVVLSNGDHKIIGYFLVGSVMRVFTIGKSTNATPLFLAPVELEYRTEDDLADERELKIVVTATDIKGTFENGPSFSGALLSTKKVEVTGNAEWARF